MLRNIHSVTLITHTSSRLLNEIVAKGTECSADEFKEEERLVSPSCSSRESEYFSTQDVKNYKSIASSYSSIQPGEEFTGQGNQKNGG